jgi:putative spermidine/putrescine transport system ATP-binding protein
MHGTQAPMNSTISTPVVQLSNVTKSYDGGATWAVAQLDLDVHQGEFLTLLGPSGSGKTTTLMMLAGFEWPDTGDILLNGQSITGLPAYKRGIGVVFQSYALFPHMTVADNLAFPLKVRGVDRAETDRRVEGALEMVALSGFGMRKPSQLSGGQQQRVAVARALVFEPKLILMDEPLGALDKRLRDQMQVELKSLQRRLGITVIYVTHDQIEALSMSDRIAVFNQGRIEQLGPPDLIYRRPSSLFVAGFMGDNNKLVGKVVAVAEPGRLTVRLRAGTDIAAVTDANLRIGDSAIVCVRPEALTIASAGGHPGQVDECMLLGDQVKLRVTCAALSNEPITVKLPAASELFAVGNKVNLDFNRENAITFRGDGS